VIKGNVRISVDSDKIKATLVFHPDLKAEEWDKTTLSSALGDAGLGQLVNATRLDNIMKDISGSRPGDKTVTIAEGVAPVPPVDSVIDFSDFDFTEEYTADIARQVFEKNPSPVVYEIRQESRKTEKIIKSKASGPFGQPKQEKKIVFEKYEKKERVSVDPEIEGLGYIGDNEILAIVKPGKPGKDGMTIFGNPIKAARPGDVKLYTSDCIKVTGNTAKSTAQGFVRRGKNWIELLPYRDHKIEISKSSDATSCLLDFTPGINSMNEINIKNIYEKCSDLGFPESTMISPEELIKLLKDAISKSSQIKAFPLNLPEDAKVLLNISGDSVKAVLSITKGKGSGKQFNLKDLAELIEKNSIKVNNPEKLKKEITNFMESSKLSLSDCVIAQGKAPTKGEDGKIVFTVQFPGEAEQKTILAAIKKGIAGIDSLESATEFPLEKIEKVAYVSKGMKVAEIKTPGQGQPGIDVYGNKIPGITGHEPGLQLYENLKMENGIIVSKTDGVIEIFKWGETMMMRAHAHRDGKLELKVADDKMRLFLNLTQGQGSGRLFSYKDLETELIKRKITRGLKKEVIDRIFQHLAQGSEIKDCIIAEGFLPHSDESGFRILVPNSSGRSINPVKKDEIVAEIVPVKKKGETGYNVFGEPVGPSSDAILSYEAGENVRKDTDKNGIVRFLANVDGRLVLENEILKIQNIRFIEGDVDAKIGNLQVPGSIHVKGNVHSGLRLFAQGDIIVLGTVGASVLSAGGSIKIHKGIAGEGKAIIRAKKKIETSFAKDAYLLAVADINIEKLCSHCVIKCNGKVFVSPKSGSIIGGKIKASKGIEAFIIGDKDSATEISFGQDYLLNDRIESEEKKVEKLKNEILKIDSIFADSKKGLSVSVFELDKKKKDKVAFIKQIERIKKDVLHLRDKFELHFPSSEIIVHGSLLPNTVIESHMRVFNVTKTLTKVIISFNQTNGLIEQTFFL
jgi:uncharacterized protein (DUF342 family)